MLRLEVAEGYNVDFAHLFEVVWPAYLSYQVTNESFSQPSSSLRTYLSHHTTPLKLKSEHRIIPEIETYAMHFTTLTQGAPS